MRDISDLRQRQALPLNAKVLMSKNRIAKVLIAITVIGIMEIITKFKDKSEKHSFELSMAILMAAWILRDGW